MKRVAAISLLAVIVCFWLSSFPAQALPDGAVARLGKGGIGWGDRVVAFSPDGATLAVATSIGVYLYNFTTLEEIAFFETNAQVNSVAFSPDGSLLASGDYKEVKLWDVATHQEVATLRGRYDVNSVAFSPDGSLLASGSDDDTVKLWDVATLQEVATLTGHPGGVESVAFSPDGSLLASGSDDDWSGHGATVKLWDVSTYEEAATLRGHSGHDVESVAFSPDGSLLASGSWDNTVKLWDVATYEEVATLTGHSKFVESVAFSPNGSLLASGSDDDTVKLWDVSTRQEVATLTGHSQRVNSVAFSPDGGLLASTSWAYGDHNVKLWDVSTRQEVAAFERSYSVHSVAFSPDSSLLAGGMDGAVKLWDVSTHQEVATLFGDSSFVSVAFSPDGSLLASGSDDDTVKLWDVSTLQEVATLTGHSNQVNSVAFSPDGSLLASGSNYDWGRGAAVKLWDVSTHQEVATFWHSQHVKSVAFSPDGRLLASGNGDDTVKLWDVSTHQEVVTLTGHSSGVYSVAFSPDGNLLASGSRDGTTLLWKVTPSSPINQPPVAAFAYSPENPTVNEEILFDASAAFDPDGQIISYEWFFGDGTAINVKTVIHRYPAGIYEVTLTVTDDLGETATANKQVTITRSIEDSWVELADAPVGVLKLRETPGTTNIDGSAKADVLMLVPNGWVFKVINGHQDTEIHDGYIWWEVENPGNNVTGWIASGKSDGSEDYFSSGEPGRAKILTSKDERVDAILEAIDHYYNGSDEHSPNLQTTDLYKSNDWGYNDNNPLGFRDENGIRYLKDNSFPIELVLAIAAQESGDFDFDNEVYGQDIPGDFLNGGVGIMQVTGTANRGWGSNLKCYTDACKSADSNKTHDYPGGQRYQHRYYTNTRQGIYANIKDGLRILQISYERSMIANIGKDEDVSWIGTVWRYNHSPDPKWCPITEDKGNYLFNIAYRLNDLSLHFGDYQAKLGQYQGYDFLSDEKKSELVQKLEKYEEAVVCSPVEIRAYDSQGRITGVTNGERLNNIPDSDSYENGLLILNSTDSYRYEAAGTEKGEYHLSVTHVEGGEATVFTATNIPTSTNISHQYIIDWDALSKGEEGVTVEIDEDGDGVPERTITSDGELTQDEYLFVTSVNPEGKLPTSWADVRRTQLFQNYPNPFNPDTWIPYILAEQDRVVIKIQATTGQLVRTLNMGTKPAGVYLSRDKAAYWDGRDDNGESVASGVYFYTLRAGDYMATKKMIIAK